MNNLVGILDLNEALMGKSVTLIDGTVINSIEAVHIIGDNKLEIFGYSTFENNVEWVISAIVKIIDDPDTLS
jgi:hypothetical protein